MYSIITSAIPAVTGVPKVRVATTVLTGEVPVSAEDNEVGVTGQSEVGTAEALAAESTLEDAAY
jgi:hypothetical protein